MGRSMKKCSSRRLFIAVAGGPPAYTSQAVSHEPAQNTMPTEKKKPSMTTPTSKSLCFPSKSMYR